MAENRPLIAEIAIERHFWKFDRSHFVIEQIIQELQNLRIRAVLCFVDPEASCAVLRERTDHIVGRVVQCFDIGFTLRVYRGVVRGGRKEAPNAFGEPGRTSQAATNDGDVLVVHKQPLFGEPALPSLVELGAEAFEIRRWVAEHFAANDVVVEPDTRAADAHQQRIANTL